jgi:hypothetical protein
MIDQILDLVKNQATDYFIQNPDVPNEQAPAAAAAAGESIMEVIQQQIMSGNMGVVQQLMGVGASNNAGGNNDMLSGLIQQASTLLSGKLQNQVGVNANAANSAAGGLIPVILGAVMDKFRSNAPGDAGFDIGSLINLVLGGGGLNTANNQNNNSQNNNPLGGLGDILGGNMGNILGNILGGGK